MAWLSIQKDSIVHMCDTEQEKRNRRIKEEFKEDPQRKTKDGILRKWKMKILYTQTSREDVRHDI